MVSSRKKETDPKQVTAVMPKPNDTPKQETPPAQTTPGETRTTEDILDESQEPEKKKGNTWLWAGIGCVVVILFLIVVGAILFDYLNLYCTPPFDTVMKFFWTCPP